MEIIQRLQFLLLLGATYFVHAENSQPISIWADIGFSDNYQSNIIRSADKSPLYEHDLIGEIYAFPFQDHHSHFTLTTSAEYHLNPQLSIGVNANWMSTALSNKIIPIGHSECLGYLITLKTTTTFHRIAEAYTSFSSHGNTWSIGVGVNKQEVTSSSSADYFNNKVTETQFSPHLLLTTSIPLSESARAKIGLFSTLAHSAAPTGSPTLDTLEQNFITHGLQCSLSYKIH